MVENYLISVEGNFYVESRLREIDDDYRVFYNKAKKRYEVHNLKFKPNTLVLVSPYDELDARLIRLVRSSSVTRASDIYKEIEEHNEKLLNEQIEEESCARASENDRLLKMKSLLEKRR